MRFYDGDEQGAFVIAVRANLAHGPPLSLPDRMRAAARMVRSHPRWSDRAIAQATGLAAATVSSMLFDRPGHAVEQPTAQQDRP